MMSVFGEYIIGRTGLIAPLIATSDFETNLTGWSSFGPTNAATITRVTTEYQSGLASMQVAAPGTLVNEGTGYALTAPLKVGVPYTVSVWMKGAIGGESVRIFLEDYLTGLGGAFDSTVTLTTAWQEFIGVWTPTVFSVNPGLFVMHPPASAATWYVDRATVTTPAIIGETITELLSEEVLLDSPVSFYRLNDVGRDAVDFVGTGSGRLHGRYASQVIDDVPVAYWRLEETSGSANDISCNGTDKPGTYTGGVSLGLVGPITADVSKAASFNTTGYMSVADDAALRLVSPFTLEAWVYPTAASAFATIIAKSNGTAPREFEWCIGDGIATFDHQFQQLTIGNGVGATARESISYVPLNAWSHVAVTYDGANIRFYLNGVADGVDATTQAIATNTLPVEVGRRGTDRYFTGRIAEVAMYSSALTVARILAHFNDATDAGGYTRGVAGPTGDGNGATTFLADGSGYGGFAQLPSSLLAVGTADFAVEMWIKNTLGNAESAFAITKSNVTTPFKFGVTNRKARVEVGGTSFNLGPNINDGLWHHLVASRTSGTVSVYVDGDYVGGGAAAGSLTLANADVRLGGSSFVGDAWKGEMDEVVFYNNPLTAARVAKHFQAASSGYIDAAVLGWLMTAPDSGRAAKMTVWLLSETTASARVRGLIYSAAGALLYTGEAVTHAFVGDVAEWVDLGFDGGYDLVAGTGYIFAIQGEATAADVKVVMNVFGATTRYTAVATLFDPPPAVVA